MPKFYWGVINTLIDQGWEYIPGRRAKKGKLIPPDPSKPAVTVAATPSATSGQVVWINRLRNSGAILDDAELERLTRADSRARLRKAMRQHSQTALEAVESNVVPISTKQNRWWAPETEVAPTRAEIFEEKQAAPPSPDDACGTAYSLGQARDMLRQGYHVKKVIKRTGWGLNHLRDLIDNTGYYHFKH